MGFELLEEEPVKEETPSFGSELLRHGARTGMRAAEQVAGFPGDILSLINEQISRRIVGGITGKETHPYEELGISKILPTSEQLRKGDIAQGGKILEPQNKVEQFIDDVTSDATSLFLPGKKISGVGKQAAHAVTKAVGANIAKETVKDLTADEKKGEYAKLGALTLLSFIDKKGAAKAISEGYGPLQDKVAKLNPVSAVKLENNLNNLKSKMQKGSLAPSEKFIVDEVDAVLSKVKNSNITPEELWALKRSLNEKLSKILYEFPQKSTQQRARKLASVISKELDDALALTAKQDPKFYKNLKSWNRAYATMADSNLVSKWIEKNLKYNPLSSGLLHLFGGPIGSITAGAILPYQVGKILYRLKSPQLLKHYSRSLSAAIGQDAIIFNRELKILDKEIQKQEKKDRFSLIED